MTPLIAGNWKMNLGSSEAAQLAGDLAAGLLKTDPAAEYLVCPPFPYLGLVADILKETPVMIGAQDCSVCENGAHTGDVSAAMLADMGCSYVIVGHSERRTDHGETDEIVRQKAAKAQAHGLVPIICVGETESQREAGQAEKVVGAQLEGSIPETAQAGNFVIAYEPVWAIGTGKTATPEDAEAMHAFIRDNLALRMPVSERIGILYGGSMKPDNAEALLCMPNINGGLIGGASLTAESFLEIGRAIS